MNTNLNIHRIKLIALVLLIAAACASTKVTSLWKDESYQKKPGKIVVMASLSQTAQRRLMEDELVRQLKATGIEAIAGYTVIPDNKPEKELITEKVRELGADALFMTKLLDRRTERDYVPGPAYYPPMSYHDWNRYYGGFYSPYPPGYPPGFGPGYMQGYPPGYAAGHVVEEVYDIAEANLYDAATGKLIWSAVTESRIKSNDKKAVKIYASEIIKSLRKRAMIP